MIACRVVAALALACLCESARAFDAWAGELTRDQPTYVRVMTHNTLNQFPNGTADQTAAHERLLSAIQPDIISYQEMDPGSALALRTRLQAVLGGTWFVHEGVSDGVNVNMLASRWPLSLQRTDTSPSSSTRGTTLALVDLPNATFGATNFYFGAIHFKCCAGTTEDAQRQRHADAIARWWGDARTSGGSITLAANTPMMVAGDFNFGYSFSQQPRATLITGDIQDNATFGADIKGDWDGTDMGEALPLDPYTFDPDTWDTSDTTPGSRFDRFYYTDSVARVAQAFVLNTLAMPADALAGAGLQATDTATASDHLPVVVDLAMGPIEVAEPTYRDLFVTEYQPDPTAVSDANGEWFEVFNATDAPIDLNGWVIKDVGGNLHVIRNPAAIVPARGHFVFGPNANMGTNGNVPVGHAFSNFFIANGADEIVLFRGSMKIDGIAYGGGDAGLEPVNTAAPAHQTGIAQMLTGNYWGGHTGTWGAATALYNASDRGTPGAANSALVGPPTSDTFVIR